jgi:hypothetical protein
MKIKSEQRIMKLTKRSKNNNLQSIPTLIIFQHKIHNLTIIQDNSPNQIKYLDKNCKKNKMTQKEKKIY